MNTGVRDTIILFLGRLKKKKKNCYHLDILIHRAFLPDDVP